ncbi:MAG: hypothetical protein J2P55_14125 [Rhizobiales bacterium]|nr:hypothetical protein [Hyphomicrobiales bacterium]
MAENLLQRLRTFADRLRRGQPVDHAALAKLLDDAARRIEQLERDR